MNKNDRLQRLLKQVRQITDKYKEIAYLKGENFNLFDILDRRTDEVKSHSAMLAELLNPKGSHGMGDVFLKLFIQMLNVKFSKDIVHKENENYENIGSNKIEETNVYVEYYIEKIEQDKGGRIDILIRNNDFQICIENKIYAKDQDSQLIRYHNFLKSSQKSLLLYLTLDGKDAESNSITYGNTTLRNGYDYYCISYKQDIINWLQQCYQASVEAPILRESIKQYLNLLKSLTNQLTFKEMENEIFKTILSDIESAELIKENFEKAIIEGSDQLKKEIISSLEDKYPEAHIETQPDNISFSSIYIWFEKECVHIGIESFNLKSINLEKYHLFIGQMDWNKDTDKEIYHNVWVKNTIKPICKTKDEYLQKLQDFNTTKKDTVLSFFVNEITTYIDFLIKK